MGYKYQLVALTSVKCRELVTSAGGKVHGRALLVGAETTKDCVGVGGVEYWMRLKLPITHTAKLHQVSTETTRKILFGCTVKPVLNGHARATS